MNASSSAQDLTTTNVANNTTMIALNEATKIEEEKDQKDREDHSCEGDQKENINEPDDSMILGKNFLHTSLGAKPEEVVANSLEKIIEISEDEIRT